MPCLDYRNEHGVSCGCFPRFPRQRRNPPVTATSAGGRGPRETATLAEGRDIYPHFRFTINTTFMIAPRTPEQDRPDMASFVEHLVEQHNRQETPPQFQLRYGRIRTSDCWHFGFLMDHRDQRFQAPTPHMDSPGEYFLMFILKIPEDDVNKPS
jgi:hypothetical protein